MGNAIAPDVSVAGTGAVPASNGRVAAAPSGKTASTPTGGLERVDENYEAKMVAFEVDCNDGTGEPVACHHVGEYMAVVKEEYERAAKVYELNCKNKGYGPSCFNLGKFYVAGKGVPQCDQDAENLFDVSCKSGHLQGCYYKAVFLYSACNEEMRHEAIQASQPGSSSSSSSNANSATNITGSRSNSNHVTSNSSGSASSAQDKKNKAEALKLFDWACNEGEVDSCEFAANHFLSPERSDRSPREALPYLEKACNSNHARSCFNLAVMYKHGDVGIPKNDTSFEEYKEKTNILLKQYGGLSGTRTG